MGEKAWSLNTSIRNPDRIPEFFYILNDFDGKLWINNDPSDVNTDKYWSDVERNNIDEFQLRRSISRVQSIML